jgi:putative SOS response-associated peptidase YedK
MCYSAMVETSFRKLERLFGARPDYDQLELLFQQRLQDRSIKIPRGMEANFDDPRNDVEARIKALIGEHRTRQIAEWDQALSKQRTRQANAERALLQKDTAKAREELRISTDKIGWYEDKLENIRRTELSDADTRIFSMWYAPVVVRGDGDTLQITPMRYHCRPAGKPKWYDKKFDGLYNARMDSLTEFWRGLFGHTHALMVLNGFYENVKRHDLSRRELAAGEKPENVVLHFKPRPTLPMLVPCVWSDWTQEGEAPLRSMALITTDPPPEIAAAGHNRCPVNLQPERVMDWLRPDGRAPAELLRVLGDRATPYYEHRVLEAA